MKKLLKKVKDQYNQLSGKKKVLIWMIGGMFFTFFMLGFIVALPLILFSGIVIFQIVLPVLLVLIAYKIGKKLYPSLKKLYPVLKDISLATYTSIRLKLSKKKIG